MPAPRYRASHPTSWQCLESPNWTQPNGWPTQTWIMTHPCEGGGGGFFLRVSPFFLPSKGHSVFLAFVAQWSPFSCKGVAVPLLYWFWGGWFCGRQVYTRVARILIAVNPFQNLPLPQPPFAAQKKGTRSLTCANLFEACKMR